MEAPQSLKGLKLKHVSEAAAEAFEYVKGRRDGRIKSLITPWVKYNEAHLDGQEWKQIVTIAGMSGSGKTAIASQLERDLLTLNPEQLFAVISFNFEMPSMRIMIRNTLAELPVNKNELLSARGERMTDAKFDNVHAYLKDDMSDKMLFYVEHPKTVEEYKFLLRAVYDQLRIPIISIADHSLLFKKASDERETLNMLYNLGDASIAMKKELPLIQYFLSQLNREIENEKRRMPNHVLNYPDKSCLFGSDALYQCADTVLINHRPSLLNFLPNSYGTGKLPTGKNDVYWHFLKLRDGDPHVASMVADFENMKMRDRTAEDDQIKNKPKTNELSTANH